MEKQKFTWEEFKKGWSENYIVIKDTIVNMMKFIKLAEENGINISDSYKNNKYNIKYFECVYINDHKQLDIYKHNQIDISYTLEEVLEDLNIIDTLAKPFYEEELVRQIVREEIEKVLLNAKLTIDK